MYGWVQLVPFGLWSPSLIGKFVGTKESASILHSSSRGDRIHGDLELARHASTRKQESASQ